MPDEPDPPALARADVDRRSAARASEETLDAYWAGGRARVIPLTREGLVPLRFGAVAAEPAAGPHRPAESYYLGGDDSAEWFAQVVDVAPRGRLAGLREVGAELDGRDAGLLAHAVALLNWHATHQRCPRCGTPTVMTHGGHVRRCPADGSQHFPRTDPAVIMLITDSAAGQALLGRQPSWPAGRYSCLAGFCEPGESAEQAVVREVAEEAGVQVRQVRYVASQPWPFPSSLMLGFRAVADPQAPLVLADDELDDARWFAREEIAAALAKGLLLPPSISIARHLVDRWLAAD